MFFYSYEWVLAFVMSYSFFVMGKYEAREGTAKDHAWLWAACSLLVSALCIRFISSHWQVIIFSQVLLYVLIAAVRVLLEQKS